jgi:TonB-dependent starch-binding outer membrane protein SusC
MRKFVLLISLLLCSLHMMAQEKTVTGKVTDEKDGTALAGVSVTVKGTTIGTATGADGSFRLSMPTTAKVLIFSFVNFDSKEITIGNSSNLNVTLTSSETSLQEVVVVGYEIKRKRDIAGATTSVKGKDIAIRPVGSFARAMQGQMPGVQVTSFNGIPGGNVTVRIRGVGSINASTTPLYIVDGVQLVTGNSLSLSSGNNSEGTNSSNLLNAINPDDIETIDVLKDPASASIYGAQAANGVVIITTKKGKQGKTKINFTSYWGQSKIIKKLDNLNATEIVQLGYEAYKNRYGATATQTTSFLTLMGATVKNDVVDPLTNYDWQDLAFTSGFVQNYDLSISGGTDKTTFFMSGGYNRLNGHVVSSDFNRGSFRLNLDHKINTKLSVGTNMTLSSFTQNGVYNGGSFGNPVRNGFMSFPTNSPYMPDGTFRSTRNGTWFGAVDNFLTYTAYNINTSNVKNLVGGTYFNYKINKNFNFRSTFNLNWNYTEEKQFDDPRGSGASTNGYVSKFATQIKDFQTNHTLNYNQQFGNGKHEVTGLLGAEYRTNVNTSFGAFGQGLPLPQFQTLSSTATANQPSEGFSDFKIAGAFAKAGYIYDDKYIVNLTVRRDGSSRFGEKTKYGVFPAISTAWRITEENFFSNRFKERNEIKLRLSYGITGNQAGIGNYASRGLFGLSGEYLGLSGGAPSQLANSDLSWEENESYNVGLDLSFFSKRITAEIDAFHSNRKKLLLSVPLPSTSGFTSITQNVGVLRNRGIELGLNTINVQKREFQWSSNLNITYVKNKVMKLAPGQTQIGTNIVIGRQLNSIFTYKYAGVNPADGRPMYYDTLGNITYIPQLRDRYYLGATLDPTWYGGFTNTLSYKGFELRFQFQYQGGNYIQNSDAAFMQRAGSTVDRNQMQSQMERWQKPGDITRVPKPYFGGTQPGANANNFTADRFFESGDFVRLKEVTITYNVAKGLIKKAGLTNASFYVSGLNLLTWSKYSMLDPELQGSDFGTYPQARQMTFGLNITF